MAARVARPEYPPNLRLCLCVCVSNGLQSSRETPTRVPTGICQKNPRAHKIKSALPPPPPKPPPKKGEFYGHGFSCRKNAFLPGVHKIGTPISGPRIADTNFTDTRICLNLSVLTTMYSKVEKAWSRFISAVPKPRSLSDAKTRKYKPKSVNERKRSQTHVRKRAQKRAKGHKRARKSSSM